MVLGMEHMGVDMVEDMVLEHKLLVRMALGMARSMNGRRSSLLMLVL